MSLAQGSCIVAAFTRDFNVNNLVQNRVQHAAFSRDD